MLNACGRVLLPDGWSIYFASGLLLLLPSDAGLGSPSRACGNGAAMTATWHLVVPLPANPLAETPIVCFGNTWTAIGLWDGSSRTLRADLHDVATRKPNSREGACAVSRSVVADLGPVDQRRRQFVVPECQALTPIVGALQEPPVTPEFDLPR